MMATCSFFGFCVVISFLWHLCFLPTSPAALQSKSACGSFIIYPDCASAVLCLPMDTAKCVLTTALQWKQTMVFIFISGLCDLGKPLYLSQLHCPVCVNTCSIVWAGWWCKVQSLSTPALCAQRLMTIGCFISRRHWQAVTQAWNTLMENTSLNMPTKAKIKSINCHAAETHLEVQAEPNGKKKGLVERWLVLCRLKATDMQPSRGVKGKLFK